MATLYDADVLYDADLTYNDALTTEVPGRYPVAINGVGFLLDDADEQYFSHRSVPVLRQQADTSDQPGSASLSAEGAWRRGMETWHKGAGQTWADKADSDPARFFDSYGVDPWTPGQLSLLRGTDQKRATSNLNLDVIEVQGTVYLSDGEEVYRSADIELNVPTWTGIGIQNGEAGTEVLGMASDGGYLYVALGANGIHRYGVLTAVSSHYSDLVTNDVAFVAGRLMASAGSSIYNVIAAGAAPTALYTHPNPFWIWRGWTAGPTHIYVGGTNNIGDSAIYKMTIQPDGTGLQPPSVALDLPSGETLLNIFRYLDFVVIATTLGIRLAAIGSDGNLTAGRSIPVPGLESHQYAGMAAHDRFVWFSWPVIATSASGLGRLDLSTFTDDSLTPAYAKDVAATGLPDGVNAVRSVISDVSNRRVFTIAGAGVWREHFSRLVVSGTLDSGNVTYGIPDPKVTTVLDVRHLPLAGAITGSLSTDGGESLAVGSLSTPLEVDSAPLPTAEARGEYFRWRLTLARAVASTATGPTVTRATLKAHPAPRRPGRIITVALLLSERDEVAGAIRGRDPRADLDTLLSYERDGVVVDYQEGDQGRRVLIEEHQWNASKPVGGAKWWNGTLVLKLREVA